MRSVSISEKYIPHVKSALKRNGFARQIDLAEDLDVSLSTVSNFLNGRPVDFLNFQEICRRLALNWQEIASNEAQNSNLSFSSFDVEPKQTISIPNRSEDEYADKFAEAANDWDTDRLYSDLRDAKQKLATSKNRQRLTPVEKACLRGLLSGYSPDEIASKLSRNPNGMRVDLSRGLYRYIEALTGREENSRQNWKEIADWLEAAGYKTPKKRQDWGEAPDVSVFYGRTSELDSLKQWIATEGCRLVALLGMGGIGKTVLAVKLAQQIQGEFEYVIWRSLRYAPPIDQLLADLISFLSNQGRTDLNDNTGDKISLLMQYLRSHRYLLVLDEWETILQAGKLVGNYIEGYEDYGELLKRVGESSHQSCLILTSREKPRDIAALSGPALPVRSLQLGDLGIDAREIFREKGLSDEDYWDLLIISYRGNPFALNIVAAMIKDLPFDGSIYEFIKDPLLLDDIEYMLEQHFNRLTELEKQIMHWLAKAGKPVSLSQFLKEIQIEASTEELLEALASLGRRSLIEKVKEDNKTLFELHPLVSKYVKKISN